MADPSSEDEGLLREWAPLTSLLQQIPLKAQRGIFTHELNLTCVDALSNFIALGTNLGLVYWYNRRKGELQRLRCENTACAVTCVKVISTVDYMVAAGNEQGIVSVFQIPKDPPDCLPESMKPRRKKQVERYTISGLHVSPVTAIEWSLNGMKLFSGDKNGLVVLTEIDFYMHLSKSVELLNEKYEIVQLSYCQQLLLVSTTYRSIVCHKEDRWRVAQVGQKERKSLGKLGATFCVGSERPQDLSLYSSRPGLRLWLADKNGIVQQTLIYKDTMMREHRHVPLVNPVPAHMKNSKVEHTFGPLHVFKENLLVTYNQDTVYVLNPTDIFVVATVSDLRKVQDVSVTRDEIFILEGDRSIIRVAYLPENVLEQQDISAASTVVDFTSRINPALPLHKIPFFGKDNIEQRDSEMLDGCNAVVTADEAIELPPIVALPKGLANLTVHGLVDASSISNGDEPKVNKEAYNRQCQSGSHSTQDFVLLTEASRAQVLDKIGEQKFEEVVFKPKSRKKKNKKRIKNKLVSGAESGSDTISVNSARSNASDNEDPWSSERLDMSSDWSGMSTRASSSANESAVKRSSSEETLVRLGDSMISEVGALPADDISSCSEAGRPSDLSISNHSGDKVSHLPHSIQPDLRSPATIERDVADKERLLAEVLNLDTLCLENVAVVSEVNQSTCIKEDSCQAITSQSCMLSPVSCQKSLEDQILEESEDLARRSSVELSDDNTESQDEKLASIGSTISYGPPSGSSALPSIHASLEITQPLDLDCVEETCQVSTREDNWVQYRTPESIVGFAVSSHYVCCIDSSSRIHYSGVNGLSLKWQKADDRGEQISVSYDSKIVWKLHKGTAYALVNPSQKGPFGEKWVVAAKDVQCISVSENVAWYVSLDSGVYIQKGLTEENPFSNEPLPVCCILPTVRVSCFEDAVWVLTSTEKVLYRDGVTQDVPEGTTWKEIAVPFPVMDMVLGSQGTGWVIDEKNVIHFTKDFTSKSPQWWQILISDYIFQPTTPLQHFCSKLTDNYLKNLRQSSTVIIAAGKNVMWISEKMADKIHMNKTEFSGHQWNRIGIKNLNPNTRWRLISARGVTQDQGLLWLLSESGDFFCYYPHSGNIHTLPVPASVVCISANSQAIWLLSNERQIYVRQMGTTLLTDSCWKTVNLTQLGNIRFVHISCGNDMVWACSDQGDVYMTIGSPRSMASPTFAPAWIPVDEKPENKFSKIFVGSQPFMVWALDKKKNIFVRQHIVPDFPIGQGWCLVSGIEAMDLTVSDSAVWALSPGGSVYRRFGITQTNCMGDYWKKIPGTVDLLTATLNDRLWALDKKGHLLKHSQLPVTLCSEEDSKLSDPCSSLDGDWEHINVNKM